MSQLSFFSEGARPPAVDDVEGLLAGPGHATLQDGGARVSVVVTDDWRAPALAAALESVGLEPEDVTTAAGERVVRCAITPVLTPLVESWTSGAVKLPPPSLVLDGPRLRWWCLAAGRLDRAGFLLELGQHDEEAWAPLGAALAGAGVPGVFLPPGGGGPAYRVVGVKRLRRLAELVGERPEGVPDEGWPARPV